MIREGSGVGAPSPVKVSLAAEEVRLLCNEAIARCQKKAYRTQWGNGLISGCGSSVMGVAIPDVAKPHLVGLVTEYAFSQYVNRRIGTKSQTDLRHWEHGDDGKDFVIDGVRYQVKSRTSKRDSSLIRHVTESGTILPQNCDRYVFCEWPFNGSVLLLGWCDRDTVTASNFRTAFKGKHWNLVVPDTELLPMTRLIEEMKCR